MTGRWLQALARAGAQLAARLLPTTGSRARYRAEFLAELHELPPAGQLRHAAGVLAGTPSLRAALRAAVEEAAMPVLARPDRSWRCRPFKLHVFAVHSTSDGGRYQQCVRCGTDRGPASPYMFTTPPYGAGG